MKRLRDALTLFILLMAGVPSALTATRLSLPSIPDFRLPSAGVVNTVFPAATGGSAPYSYSVSGLPPGITFSAGSRRASGTLPTVATETTYTVTYGVTDGAGASASVSFSATVVPPPAPPPPPPPPPSTLSLPTIPDFRLASGGSVDTVFPAATGGRRPYSYSVSGLPAGISFSSSTRRARGTLPTVLIDSTYTVTYSVRDSRGATDSVTFTAVVTAATAPPPDPPPDPQPPPDDDDDDDDDDEDEDEDDDGPGVSRVRLYNLPFTVSETGEGEKDYQFSLPSSGKVTVSLTGMNRDIDCRVNSSRCTNRGGTKDDSWSGTLAAGTHTVTVYPYNADSGNWTVSVSATATAPPPAPTPSGPTRVRRALDTRVGLVYAIETDSAERTYRFTLASTQIVSVSLTGMDRDIDCSVNGSRCTNRGGAADDSWNGTLAAGFYSVRVYPYLGGTGDWTVSVIVNCPAGHFAAGGACHRYVVPQPTIAALGGEGPEEVLSCDGDTELGEGQQCVDGVVVYSDEIVVTSTPPIAIPPPGTSIPPPTAPTQPTTPTPPTTAPPFPRGLWPQQLRDAVDDAVTKSETCSVRTNGRELKSANAKLTAARDAGRIVPGGPACDGETAAHVDAIEGTTIHICSEFFDQSAPRMSLTIMHEGLHLAGVTSASTRSPTIMVQWTPRSEAHAAMGSEAREVTETGRERSGPRFTNHSTSSMKEKTMIRGLEAKFASTNRRRRLGRRWRQGRVLLLAGVVLAVPAQAAGAAQAQSEWSDEVSPAGLVSVWAIGVSRPEAEEYLDRLGLRVGAVADPEVSIYGSDAFHGVQEVRADWGTKQLELNGRFALRQTTEVLGRSMTVTAVIGSDGLLITDDRGGSRIVAYRKFPLATCSVGPEGNYCADATSFDMAMDDRGTIVEFVRDREGFPRGVRFGETLLLRYDFTPTLPDPPVRAVDPWREPSSWELVDLWTSEIVIDSVDAAKVASQRPRLSVYFLGIGEVLRIEDRQTFAVAEGIRQAPHALIPIGTHSDVWRSVYANGDRNWKYKFRVDYTDDIVRAEINTTEYGRSIVVEAPRSRDSVAPVSFVHPDADRLTDALRSGVRLRTADPVEAWLESGFDKESLPIVLRPLHYRGTERGMDTFSGVSRAATRAEAVEFDFGPAAGCEDQGERVVCPGGEVEVIGEESSYPW